MTKEHNFSKVISLNYKCDEKGEVNTFVSSTKLELEESIENTKAKVSALVERFKMKPVGYLLGGFGDNTHLIPNGDYLINKESIEILIKEGWKVLNRKA